MSEGEKGRERQRTPQAAGDAFQFGVTAQQLVEIMSHRNEDERARALAEYEGVEGIMAHLQVNTKMGLPQDPAELARRQAVFGKNVIPPTPPKSFIALCFDAIQDKTLIILMTAAFISIILGVTLEERKEIGWIDGFAILSAVAIVVLVTATNDWSTERKFRGLHKKLESDSRFTVIRDGDIIEVTHADIVVGDIAEFKYGNTFPVDGILIQGNDVRVNESALTGEAELVRKKEITSAFLYSGTQVMEGRGTMVVTAVGPNSKQGQIFTLMREIREESGFITEALKKLRVRCFGEPETTDPESGQGGPQGEQNTGNSVKKETVVTEVYEYNPSDPPDGDSGGGFFSCCKKVRRKMEKNKEEEATKKEEDKDALSSESVLQKKLNKLAVQIGYGGTAAAVVAFFVLSIRFSVEEYGIAGRGWDSATDFSILLHFVIIGITVLVVAIPEGLPLAVTIALAYSVQKMLKDNNLVRHLNACETMGNATSICSDKTGTLTTNRMTVVESYFAGTHYDVTPKTEDLPPNLLDMLQKCVAINSNYTSLLLDPSQKKGSVQASQSVMEKVKGWLPCWRSDSRELLGQGLKIQVGNVTECALLGLLEELNVDYTNTREAHPTNSFTKVFTFNSARKSMSTIIPRPDGSHLLLCKGASELILNKCDSIIGENGKIVALSAQDRKNIVSNVVQPMANGALRTLCMAYREIPAHGELGEAAGDSEISSQPHNFDNEEEMVTELTCIGIVGIQDPVRPEVPHCIQQCQEAGIVVRMVTGDNVDTARAIAIKCGIISENNSREKEKVMDGKEFNRRIRERGEVSQQMFDRVWPRLKVLARSSPQDKHTLVKHIIRSTISKNREVVAVTGDGTNDGPALRKADVGFAMGIAGTDVAKEACDIILTDDNFASIVKAVKWGRNVYDSISKFLQFQLTVNIVAVSITIISAFTITDSPLRAIQMLWVNLIMDTLASLALATENPTDDLLKRKPYGRTKALISRHMWLFMIGHSIYQLGVLLVLVFAGAQLFDIQTGIGRELREDPTQHFTMVFNTFVFMQLFNEINARKIHGERNVFDKIWTNWIFMLVMLSQTIVQVIIVQFGDIVFGTTGLSLDQWLWCVCLGSWELVVNQILLCIPVRLLPVNKLKFWKSTEEVDTFEQPYDVESTRAQVMWMKSLRRIQTQIRVVNAFRSGLESGHLLHVSQLPTLQETPRSGRYQDNQTIEGKVTSV